MAGNTLNRNYPYPSGTDANDVPYRMQALAEAIDADVEALSDAVNNTWTYTVNSTGFDQTIAGAMVTLTGMAVTEVDVPAGRTLEIEVIVPIVDLPGGSGTQPTIEAAISGGSYTTLGGAYFSNSNAASIGLPMLLRASYFNATSETVAVAHRARGNKIGSGSSIRLFHGAGFPVQYRHRVT